MPLPHQEDIPTKELKEILHLSPIHEKILITLKKKDHLCGVQIIEALEEATKLKNIITTNSLYPTLKRLEEKKYIEYEVQNSLNDMGKAKIKFYKITDLGRKMLENAKLIRKEIEDYQIN